MRELPTTAAAATSADAVGSILGDERDDGVTPDVDPGGWRFATGRLPA